MSTSLADRPAVRALVVDDEPYLADLVAMALRYEGWEVRTAGTGAAALEAIAAMHPDIVVLDVMLPDTDGFTLLRRLRDAGDGTPVLFLTARDATEDRVSGLRLGADDYVVKPFSLEELVARVRAVLRRTTAVPARGDALVVGDLVIDEDGHDVRYRGARIVLTPTEFELLRFLARNHGVVVSKVQILDRVWEYDFRGNANVVELYVGYLRRPWPLALRLSVGLTLLAALVLLVSAVVVTAALRAFLLDRLDQQVLSLSGSAAGVLALDATGDTDDSALRLPPGGVAVAVGPDGDVVAAHGVQGAAAAQLAATAAGRSPGLVYTAALDDDTYRLAVGAEHDEGRTVVGLPLDPVDGTIERLLAIEALVSLVALVVVALGGYLVVAAEVRPLRRMSAEARRLARTDLTGPVPTDDGPLLAMHLPRTGGSAEVQDLSESLRGMVGHIDASLAARAAAEERLRQFVADASHELRTPLSSIRGYAELGRRGMTPDPESAALASRRIEDEAARMSTLVDDLLLLARLDQGRPLVRDEVDLAALAADACADLRAVDSGREVVLRVPSTPREAVVRGDGDRLRQVLANLLSNARHHTPPGTAVELEVSGDGDEVTLLVRDHGPGIPVDAQARVFERFYRVDPGRSRDRGGSGLGLSIVASVVQAHGGRTELDSSPDGTTVAVVLPAAR